MHDVSPSPATLAVILVWLLRHGKQINDLLAKKGDAPRSAGAHLTSCNEAWSSLRANRASTKGC